MTFALIHTSFPSFHVMQVEDFIEKKTDLSDPVNAWTAYRNIIRMYTNVILTAWQHGEQGDMNNNTPLLSEESSNRSMRHSAVFGGNQAMRSELEKVKDFSVDTETPSDGLGERARRSVGTIVRGPTATILPGPQNVSSKIKYSVDEKELEARMDTEL